MNAGDIDLSTSAGRTNAIILGRINQQYSEDTRDKIKRKKRELAERGLPSGGGIRAFGFTGTGKQKVSRLRALQEQELINEAVDYLLAGGTIIGLVKDWKRRGIKTINGGRWRGSHVRTMLLSPSIAGETHYNGCVICRPIRPGP